MKYIKSKPASFQLELPELRLSSVTVAMRRGVSWEKGNNLTLKCFFKKKIKRGSLQWRPHELVLGLNEKISFTDEVDRQAHEI